MSTVTNNKPKEECFLCTNSSFVEVTSVIPMGIIQYPICEEHYLSFEDDADMSIAVLTHAASISNLALPAEATEFAKVLQEHGILKAGGTNVL